MIVAEVGHYVLSERWPTWLLVAGATAAAGGWVALYRLQRRLGGGRSLMHSAGGLTAAAVRIGLAFGGVWLVFQVLGRMFLLATDWPLWPVALAAVLLAEALIWLYELERRIVPRRSGLLLTGLRLVLLGLVILMLLQPVFASVWGQTTKRRLVVLVDESASMRIADGESLAPHERLRLAETLSIPAARRPWRLEENAEKVRAIREDLLGELAWLNRLVPGGVKVPTESRKKSIAAQLKNRRKALHEKVTAAAEGVAEQVAAADSLLREGVLAGQMRTALLDAKAKLSRQVRPPLLSAAGWTHEENASKLPGDLTRLRKALHAAADGLAKAYPALEAVGAALDSRLYKQLTAADRAAVDAAAKLTRLELATAVLLHKPNPTGEDKKTDKSLLEHLTEQYNVKVYTFAAGLTEANPDDWTDPVAAAIAKAGSTGSGESKQPDSPAADEIQRTNLAGALRKIIAETGDDDLAGVLVLTDGQDNSKVNLEPLARALGGAGAAFCAAVTGGTKPPTDAAVVSIEAPETVYLSDKMFINVELKLDGLKGKNVSVRLLRQDKRVDTKSIRVAGETFRTRIQLADQPKKTGLYTYSIEIDRCEGEVFTDNNSYSLTLSVTDDKTKVLLVDSRPRWEFRYLKNLFCGRDKTVRLQYVLTAPDSFTGQPARKDVPASVERPAGATEATALPKDEREWMKFDVIIIGDVPAGMFSDKAVRSIRKFVTDRGGTVVLIAGPRFMPRDFATTGLAELMPVRLDEKDAPRSLSRRGFRIALTPTGRQHVIGRQDVEAKKSLDIWNSFPPLFWHSRFTRASGAGTVLAYALQPNAPKWLTGAPPGNRPASVPASLIKRREQYRRDHALITVAPHGLGKVMMIGFDRTWRLRYRTGDTHHHKFWGQVLRWATAGKLPAGTHLVKLGTDKTRYPPHSRPIVRARLLREDFSPVVTDQLAVKVFRKDKYLARAAMKYVKDSPGMYTARLDELPAGGYRLELEGPVVDELLAGGSLEKVSTEISVDPSAPTEQIELAANRHLLARLAELSHNGAVVPSYQARRLLPVMPAGKVTKKHRRQFLLWDSWPLLVLFCAVAAAEWILRKRFGLT